MLKKKTILICTGLLLAAIAGLAQSSGKDSVREAFRTLAEQYKRFKALSFTIEYRYSTEAQPERFLDSLRGEFELSGDRYRYILDSNVYVGDSSLSVVVFKNDRILYLSRASRGAAMQNPMTIMDSMLLRGDSVEAHLADYKDGQEIVLQFKRSDVVKRIEYYIDRKSGLLVKMRYIVPAREMVDASVRSQVSQQEAYAVIETDFSRYREVPLERADFDLGRYVKKENGKYIAVAPYENYKIFRASPNLP